MKKQTTKRNTLVSEVMTSAVRTATADTTLDEIGRLFISEGCHHLPIVDADGRPIGMVSSHDVVEALRERGETSLLAEAAREVTANEVMSAELETIYDDHTVDRAIERIGRGDIHALVVLDHDDGLAGIVTHRDLLTYMLS